VDPTGKFAVLPVLAVAASAYSVYDWLKTNVVTSDSILPTGSPVDYAAGAAGARLGGGLVNATSATGAVAENIGASNVAQFERLKASLAAREATGAPAIGRALESDSIHRSASFMLNSAAENGRTFTILNRDGTHVNLLQTKGDLSGKRGIYEWITNKAGDLTHQRFIESGNINGIPNQRPDKLPSHP
jgi:filamentous hemagglutinin